MTDWRQAETECPVSGCHNRAPTGAQFCSEHIPPMTETDRAIFASLKRTSDYYRSVGGRENDFATE